MSRFLVSIIALISFSTSAVEIVSLTSLLATPERYDGKCVQTVGVISVEFEGGRIYLDQASYIARAHENAVGQPFEALLMSEQQEVIKGITEAYEGKMVRLVGVFSEFNSISTVLSPKSMFKSINFVETLKPNNRDKIQIGEHRSCS